VPPVRGFCPLDPLPQQSGGAQGKGAKAPGPTLARSDAGLHLSPGSDRWLFQYVSKARLRAGSVSSRARRARRQDAARRSRSRCIVRIQFDTRAFITSSMLGWVSAMSGASNGRLSRCRRCRRNAAARLRSVTV
jgi:hypothetical protein